VAAERGALAEGRHHAAAEINDRYGRAACMWYNNTVRRLFQDDLPSVSISPLRAAGRVTTDMECIDIAFGAGDDALRRRVRVTHVSFQNGGSWSFFRLSCLWPSSARSEAA
jgi:hypothetical protein